MAILQQIGAKKKAKSADSLGLTSHDVVDLVKTLLDGLPFAKLQAFSEYSGLTASEIAEVLRIPPRTMARRKTQGALTGEESERLARLAGLFDKTRGLFEGDSAAALTWLRTPAKALGKQTPLALAATEIGGRAVEDLIGRLEFGVYS